MWSRRSPNSFGVNNFGTYLASDLPEARSVNGSTPHPLHDVSYNELVWKGHRSVLAPRRP